MDFACRTVRTGNADLEVVAVARNRDRLAAAFSSRHARRHGAGRLTKRACTVRCMPSSLKRLRGVT